MKKYKSFLKQCVECDKNGDRWILEKNPLTHIGFYICNKYKTYCHSKVCFKERTNQKRNKCK